MIIITLKRANRPIKYKNIRAIKKSYYHILAYQKDELEDYLIESSGSTNQGKEEILSVSAESHLTEQEVGTSIHAISTFKLGTCGHLNIRTAVVDEVGEM